MGDVGMGESLTWLVAVAATLAVPAALVLVGVAIGLRMRRR